MKIKPRISPERPIAKIATTATTPSIRKILVTTDFSDESLSGVRHAAVLAEKLDADVVLLHVMEEGLAHFGVESALLALKDSQVVAKTRTQLAKLAKRESSRHMTVTVSVRTGKPFQEITTAAREHKADLIVIATHGYRGARRVLLGSTAERVVRHAPCPVLTVPARAAPSRVGKAPQFNLKKILVPIDFSEISKEALPWATSLAAHFGAEIMLVHVVEEFPIDYLLGRELMSETITPLIKMAEADLQRMAQRLGKSARLNMSAVVRSGKPFEEICQAAKTLGADLIVLTTHGYTGLKHVWLGSTAERVVRHATCPVLVVRRRKLDSLRESAKQKTGSEA